jgi:hypothetical protein
VLRQTGTGKTGTTNSLLMLLVLVLPTLLCWVVPGKGKESTEIVGVRELTNERHERKSQGEAKTWGGEGDRATRG